MLNQITKNTEIKAHSEQNLTTFSIDVGLHPKDIEHILNFMCNYVNKDCENTKRVIDIFNKELDYLNNTLNLK